MIWFALLLFASSAVEHYERANALFQQQKFAEAGAALDAALAQDPNLVPALTLRGKLAMGLNRFDIARESLTRAAELAPDSGYAQFLLGFFHYVDNDFNKAISPLQRAIQLNPKDAQAHFYLAMTHEGLARPAEALTHYEKSLALADSADTRVAFARLLFSLGRYAESQQQVDRARTIDPTSRDAAYESGRLAYERGDWERAAAAGERALALAGMGTTDRQIHYLLARAYGKLGKQELARKHLTLFKASGASLRR